MNLSLFLSVASLVMGQGDPKLSLDQAVQIGIDNAYSIKLKKNQLIKVRDQQMQARSASSLQVTGVGQYTLISETKIPNFGTTSNNLSSGQAGVQITMPIDVNGNVRRNLKAIDFGVGAAEQGVLVEVMNLKASVRQGYNAVLQAEAQVKVNQQALDGAKARLKNAENMLKGGELAKVDVLRAQSEVAQAESDLQTGQNRVELTKSSLNNLLGRPVDTKFEPEEYVVDPMVEGDLASLREMAMKTRPDIASLDFTIKQLSKLVELQENMLRPSVNLTGSHMRFFQQNSGFGQPEYSSSAAVQISWPIFDSGINKYKTLAAKRDVDQAKIQLDQLKLGASLEIQQALLNLHDAQSRLSTNKANATAAEEAYRLASLKFNAGDGIQVEVIDAQTALTRARTSLVSAQYDYLNAYAQLQKALGTDLVKTDKTGEKN